MLCFSWRSLRRGTTSQRGRDIAPEDEFNLLGKYFNKMALDLKQSIVYVADIFKSMSDSLMAATPEGTIQVDAGGFFNQV